MFIIENITINDIKLNPKNTIYKEASLYAERHNTSIEDAFDIIMNQARTKLLECK